MKTKIKTLTLDELANTFEANDRPVLLKLHNYLTRENIELYQYLEMKNELNDFLVSRVNSAIKSYKSGILANYPFPEELLHETLYIGIENSYSEYVESMIDELPVFKLNLNRSSRQKEIINELTVCSLSIFYSMISIPYSISQETLDYKLLKLIERKSKSYKFDKIKSPDITEFQTREPFQFPVNKKEDKIEEMYIPF